MTLCLTEMQNLTQQQTNGQLLASFRALASRPRTDETCLAKSVIQEEIEFRTPGMSLALDQWSFDTESAETQDEVVLRLAAGLDRDGRRS